MALLAHRSPPPVGVHVCRRCRWDHGPCPNGARQNRMDSEPLPYEPTDTTR